jgi:hypothetical protein
MVYHPLDGGLAIGACNRHNRSGNNRTIITCQIAQGQTSVANPDNPRGEPGANIRGDIPGLVHNRRNATSLSCGLEKIVPVKLIADDGQENIALRGGS